MKGIHIFTRDLRVEDNLSLNELSSKCDVIYAIFVFTPEQVVKNSYKSDRAVKFMVQCLKELGKKIKLNFFYGSHIDVIKDIHKKNEISYVSIAEDYTPYAKLREKSIKSWCDKNNIEFLLISDHCLTHPKDILTNSNTTYSVYTPYYNKAKQVKVSEPQTKTKIALFKKLNISDLNIDKFYNEIDLGEWDNAGRKAGLLKLKNLSNFKDYETKRNRIDKNSTRLSAYLKFGVISIREAYFAAKKLIPNSEPLIRELYFRDFYAYISYHNPYVFGNNFNKKININWKNQNFDKWKKGETGVPLVDASMKELNETGFMHNRGRMVVAMFLTKNLLVDWKFGEKYFAQQLIDYDPSSNNGGWQWAAGTGADGVQYTRVMNPFIQLVKVDPDCIYTKKYIPQIENIPNKYIKKWDEKCSEHENYKCPIVDVSETRKQAIQIFKP